jgi:FdhD protein
MQRFMEIPGLKYTVTGEEWVMDKIIRETAVDLTVNGQVWMSFMCTPDDLEALAVGFLFNEAVIQSADELASVRVCENGDNVDVWLAHSAEPPQVWKRTSGCSGGHSGEGIEREYRVPDPEQPISPAVLLDLMTFLYQSQDLHHETGGTHSSALSDGEKIVIHAEDIGRHNTLDKIAGRLLLEPHAFTPRILLTTGRISSEMLQKAARMNAVLLVSRTTPTDLAVTLAQKWHITLVGYARRERFTIYSHPGRIG